MRVKGRPGVDSHWPWLLMLLAVGIWSCGSVVVAVSGAARAPFLFGAAMDLGSVVGYLGFLVLSYCSLLYDRRVMLVVARHALLGGRVLFWLVLGAASGLSYPVFAVSTLLVDVSVAAVLFDGLWPFFVVVLFSLLYRGSGRYRSFTVSGWLLLLVGMCGAVLVVSSNGLVLGGAGVLRLLAGVGLAALSSFLGPLACFMFRWASALVVSLRLDCPLLEPEGGVRLELFGAVCGGALASLVSLLVNVTLGLSVGERLVPVLMLVGLVLGLLTYTVGGVAWRVCNLMTRSPGINALGYLTPAFSLGLLWLFRQVGVAYPALLVLGALLVVVANLLVNGGSWLLRVLQRCVVR